MSDLQPVPSQDMLTRNSAVKVTESAAEMSDQAEAVLLMKEHLPFYVIGYDKLKVISKMKSDDLHEVEQHISKFEAGFNVSGIFKILPGHCKWIMKFIVTVQQELTKKLLKRTLPHKHYHLKKKINNQEPVSESLLINLQDGQEQRDMFAGVKCSN